jgi:hypothetical protein
LIVATATTLIVYQGNRQRIKGVAVVVALGGCEQLGGGGLVPLRYYQAVMHAEAGYTPVLEGEHRS